MDSTGSLGAPSAGAPARYFRSIHATICFSYVSKTPVADMINTTIPAAIPAIRWSQKITLRMFMMFPRQLVLFCDSWCLRIDGGLVIDPLEHHRASGGRHLPKPKRVSKTGRPS